MAKKKTAQSNNSGSNKAHKKGGNEDSEDRQKIAAERHSEKAMAKLLAKEKRSREYT